VRARAQDNITEIIGLLESQQIHTFYEAVGAMISAAPQPTYRDALITKLFSLPNKSWRTIIASSQASPEFLMMNESTLRNIGVILKTNVRAATSLGYGYVLQLGVIFVDLLHLYKVLSVSPGGGSGSERAFARLACLCKLICAGAQDHISKTVATQGVGAASHIVIRLMRTVKKETLKLIEVFVQSSEDDAFVTLHFVPPMLEAVLGDYQSNVRVAEWRGSSISHALPRYTPRRFRTHAMPKCSA
jgi:exportin-1